MPEAIRGYWAGANAGDAEAASGWFAPEAVVRDEGGRYEGREEIRGWIANTTEKYGPVVEPLGVEVAGEEYRVRGRVTGSFPGSPVELDFAFTVRGERIVDLEVA